MACREIQAAENWRRSTGPHLSGSAETNANSFAPRHWIYRRATFSRRTANDL